MSKPLKFEARLVPTGPNGSWCYLHFPFDVADIFGTRGRVPVSGTVNGFPFRSSIVPMDGKHLMCINKQMQAGAKAGPGDVAHFIMQRDEKPRSVEIPPPLKRAFAAEPKARAVFEKLSYTFKKEHALWVAAAKKEETVQRRIKKLIELLLAKEKVTA